MVICRTSYATTTEYTFSQACSGYFFLFFTIDFLQKYVLKKANKFQMMEIIQNF